MKGFGSGAALVLRDFALQRTRPRLMLLGLLPASIVAAALTALVVLAGIGLPALAGSATSFAAPSGEGWHTALQVDLVIVVLVLLVLPPA